MDFVSYPEQKYAHEQLLSIGLQSNIELGWGQNISISDIRFSLNNGILKKFSGIHWDSFKVRTVYDSSSPMRRLYHLASACSNALSLRVYFSSGMESAFHEGSFKAKLYGRELRKDLCGQEEILLHDRQIRSGAIEYQTICTRIEVVNCTKLA